MGAMTVKAPVGESRRGPTRAAVETVRREGPADPIRMAQPRRAGRRTANHYFPA
jgi:hypothetical protein